MTRDKVEELIYGGAAARRFTQDSPVLIDVWIAYAEHPEDPESKIRMTGDARNRPLPVLLTPYQGSSGENLTGKLSVLLYKRIGEDRKARGLARPSANIGYNQSTVVANLWFDELVRVVLPLSQWWTQRICPTDGPGTPASTLAGGNANAQQGKYNLLKELEREDGRTQLIRALEAAEAQTANRPKGKTIDIPGDKDSAAGAVTVSPRIPRDVLWMARVIGTIAADKELAREESVRRAAKASTSGTSKAARTKTPGQSKDRAIPPRRVVEALQRLLNGVKPEKCETYVHSVSVNRAAESSVAKSRVSVKADAAYRLFDLSCAELSWAIIDSGIDATHPAFRLRGKDGKMLELQGSRDVTNTRVLGTYDFTLVRYLLSAEEPDVETMPPRVRERYDKFREWLNGLAQGDGRRADYDHLKDSLRRGKHIDWEVLTPFINVEHDGNYIPPQYEHGTHVAGILAGDWRRDDRDMRSKEEGGDVEIDGNGMPTRGEFPFPDELVGVCRDLNIYDLRVLDDAGRGDEFNVIAALQYVRHLRHHRAYQPIHGVNLSLAIRHDVANYACGRTPVCDECERLVGAGVIVVAAAGNEGYKHYTTVEGRYDGYQDMSITDPGNAEAVITVGSTHRFQPHTYGVSYFSSRGPTGDGRAKPDLVAPGEKIDAPIPGGNRKPLDGTSMAAPHVSGAAALLIARHRELAGQPVRIKHILCKTATDLGRERYFQGHGMVDVLRALQFV
jgi:hypothetical protein